MALLALATFFISGCDPDAYSDDMTYPLRSDPLVVSVPTNISLVGIDPPGTLSKLPARLKQLGGKVLDPKDLSGMKDADRRELEKQLAELEKQLPKIFGKPASPKVDGNVGDSEEKIADALKLNAGKGLAAGSKLFRHHCLHCHGLTGDGHGPTAEWVNPHPRDYRQGIFKFTSSNQVAGKRKPRREDLKRTLQNGIEGTSMPSFALLTDDELEELISYVIHLSIRGEVEYHVMEKLLEKASLEGDSVEGEVEKQQGLVVGNWVDAQDTKRVITPGKYPGLSEGSVKNGYRLFIDQGGAGCVSCHKDFGRQNNYKYDSWGTIVRPIDFTRGVFRGGRRPIDLYWRIHGGITGANMAAFYDALKSTKGEWELLLVTKPEQVPDDKKSARQHFEEEVNRLKLSDADRTDIKRFVELDNKKEKTAEEAKELKDKLEPQVDAINGRIATQRSWDLVDFIQILPYPEMRRRNGIEID